MKIKKIVCDNCGKEIENKDKINTIKIHYNGSIIPNKYELCDACYKAMKREIPKLLNWRNRLR